MSRSGPRLVLALLALSAASAACGLRSPPRPEEATTDRRIQHSAQGIELRLGVPPAPATGWVAWLDPPFHGPAHASAAAGEILRITLSDLEPHTLHVHPAAPGWLGEPSEVIVLQWRPPAPEAPVAFCAQGQVQLSWLPTPPFEQVRILRDDTQIAQLPIEQGHHQEPAPPGPRSYQIVGLRGGYESAPSAAIAVQCAPQTPEPVPPTAPQPGDPP